MTESPRAGTAAAPHPSCVATDVALEQVASRVARRAAENLPELTPAELAFALRSEGSPYVWPRAWSARGVGASREELMMRLSRWLEGLSPSGVLRCGVGAVESSTESVVAAVVSDVVADVGQMPLRARANTWLDVRSQLLLPAQNAKLVVLGPSGAPHAVPTSLSGEQLRARVHLDRPGLWLLQVLPTFADGPRPAAEALVYVDVEPPAWFEQPQAPGEAQLQPTGAAEVDAAKLVAAARRSERLAPLARDARLDQVAQAHALAMMNAQRVSHDVGDGHPNVRLEKAGFHFKAAGENVAHALDVRRAQRALWASPSHRSNMLHPAFNTFGLGIARDTDGSVWLCQVFTDSGTAGIERAASE